MSVPASGHDHSAHDAHSSHMMNLECDGTLTSPLKGSWKGNSLHGRQWQPPVFSPSAGIIPQMSNSSVWAWGWADAVSLGFLVRSGGVPPDNHFRPLRRPGCMIDFASSVVAAKPPIAAAAPTAARPSLTLAYLPRAPPRRPRAARLRVHHLGRVVGLQRAHLPPMAGAPAALPRPCVVPVGPALSVVPRACPQDLGARGGGLHGVAARPRPKGVQVRGRRTQQGSDRSTAHNATPCRPQLPAWLLLPARRALAELCFSHRRLIPCPSTHAVQVPVLPRGNQVRRPLRAVAHVSEGPAAQAGRGLPPSLCRRAALPSQSRQSCRMRGLLLAIWCLQEQLAAHRLLPCLRFVRPGRHRRSLRGAACWRLPVCAGRCLCRYGLPDGNPRETRAAGEAVLLARSLTPAPAPASAPLGPRLAPSRRPWLGGCRAGMRPCGVAAAR